MNNRNIIRLSLISILILIAGTYLLKIGGEGNAFLTNLLYLFPPLVAILGGAYVAKTYGLKTTHGTAFLSITIGILFLFLGEALWFIFKFILNIDPYPSFADLFYLLSYPFIFSGFIDELRLGHVNWEKMGKFTLFILALLVAVLSLTIFYFGVYLPFSSDLTLTEQLVAISYNIGDFILMILSLLVLKVALNYKDGKLFYSWIFIFLGLVLMLTGDIFFAIYTVQYENVISPYNLIDLFWVTGYLSMAYAFFGIGATIREIAAKIAKTKV